MAFAVLKALPVLGSIPSLETFAFGLPVCLASCLLAFLAVLVDFLTLLFLPPLSIDDTSLLAKASLGVLPFFVSVFLSLLLVLLLVLALFTTLLFSTL